MKYTLKKYEESLNHFKEQVCKHCCEWNKSLRHCNTCVTATAKEALQMAIEALEKQATSDCASEWIPVSERLPENADEYVLITVNGTYKNITYEDAIMLAVYDRDEGWIIDGYQYWLTAQVTACSHFLNLTRGKANDRL